MYTSNGINEIVLSSGIKFQLPYNLISIDKPMLDCISDIPDHFDVLFHSLVDGLSRFTRS